MAYDLKKFSAGPMDKGVEVQQMQLLEQLLLDIDSYNVTQGIQQGLGPRYGMSTIPGQADNETLSGTRLPGLRGSEENNANPYFANRTKVYAVFPISLQDPSTNEQKTYYAFIMAAGATDQYLEILLCSTDSANIDTTSVNIYDGFGRNSSAVANITADNIYAEAIIPGTNTARNVPLQNYLIYSGTPSPFLSAVAATVSNGTVPMQWIMGLAKTDGDATHAPDTALYEITGLTAPSGNIGTFPTWGGIPSEYNLASYRTTPRRIKVYTLTSNGDFNIEYSLTFVPSSSTVTADKLGSNSTVLTFSNTTAHKDTGGTTYTNSDVVLINDNSCLTDSSYQAILIAQDRPIACLFQSAYQHSKGRFNQWIDLTQHSFDPTPSGVYSEEGSVIPCSFITWPDFVRGTPMVTAFPDMNGPGLGGPNSGILRANTVYEFTYSLYNKRLNFETNVGKSVKIQTGTDDFVALQLFFATAGLDTMYDEYVSGNVRFLPYPFSSFTDVATHPPNYTGTSNFINFYDYRFYFRQEGTFEWLPAYTIEACQLWFRPNYSFFACTGALAATTGGQPGGFNDYSPLPKDQYIDVKVFNNRAFWCSPKAICFSLQKNFLAYAGRNSIACPQGFFRGMITHAYPGQAQQSSRIVVFGSEQVYTGRFTGIRAQTSVQVSPDATGVFDVEGSDFVLDPWTSITAFSWRSAVVADGILHYWGPQGIYRDDGLAIPTKISGPLEPNIFTFYDPGRTDEIHSSYNPTTKEITWFYPAPGATTTSTLVYNVDNGTFLPGSFACQVDWSQSLNIQTAAGTSGKRLIMGVRASSATTLQRAYFYDFKNRAGDMTVKKDFIIKTVSMPVTGTRRLTLAAGYDATNFAAITTGQYVAIQQFNDYTGQTTGTDLIAVITAVNTGSGYLDITLPTDAVLPNVSLTYDKFFPIWIGNSAGTGYNQFPYRMTTNYWAPAGINGYFFWYYVYLLSKIRLWKTDIVTGIDPVISYRTPTASAYVSDQLTLEDNSDGNWQLYHPLVPGNDNQEGQAIRFRIDGNQLGHEWVLQYLEAHAKPIEGDPLKRFEG